METEPIVLFALDESRPFGDAVARALDTELSPLEERTFDDGEHATRPLVSVRGRDVFVIQSLYDGPHCSINDKLIRLLFLLGTLRDAAAGRVTAVLPYLAYSRKDRQTAARDPVTTRYVAALIEAAGADRVLTLDVHNLAAFQNAFRIGTDHLTTDHLFVEHFAKQLAPDEPVTVLSPDAGGIKRAEQFRKGLADALQREVASGLMEKERSPERLITGRVIGEVTDRTVVIVDDMISTGRTLVAAARGAKALGARRIYAAVTHGLFVGDANARVADDSLDALVVTDTVPPFRLDPTLAKRKLTVLSSAGLVAEAIRRIHISGSLASLLAD